MTESESHIAINLWLAGRSYRIRIRQEEEEAVRNAAKAADEQITELRHHYAGKDDQDFVAMCLLMYATSHTGENISPPTLQHKLDTMIRSIDNALEEPPESTDGQRP